MVRRREKTTKRGMPPMAANGRKRVVPEGTWLGCPEGHGRTLPRGTGVIADDKRVVAGPERKARAEAQRRRDERGWFARAALARDAISRRPATWLGLGEHAPFGDPTKETTFPASPCVVAGTGDTGHGSSRPSAPLRRCARSHLPGCDRSVRSPPVARCRRTSAPSSSARPSWACPFATPGSDARRAGWRSRRAIIIPSHGWGDRRC